MAVSGLDGTFCPELNSLDRSSGVIPVTPSFVCQFSETCKMEWFSVKLSWKLPQKLMQNNYRWTCLLDLGRVALAKKLCMW